MAPWRAGPGSVSQRLLNSGPTESCCAGPAPTGDGRRHLGRSIGWSGDSCWPLSLSRSTELNPCAPHRSFHASASAGWAGPASISWVTGSMAGCISGGRGSCAMGPSLSVCCFWVMPPWRLHSVGAARRSSASSGCNERHP